jgi:hypothetical protein
MQIQVRILFTLPCCSAASSGASFRLHLWLLLFNFSLWDPRAQDIARNNVAPCEGGLSQPNDMSAFCKKHQCNGHWRPPKTHHCSICKVCRLGFDHHCHFVCHSIQVQLRSTMLKFITGWNVHHLSKSETFPPDVMAHSYSGVLECHPHFFRRLVTIKEGSLPLGIGSSNQGGMVGLAMVLVRLCRSHWALRPWLISWLSSSGGRTTSSSIKMLPGTTPPR